MNGEPNLAGTARLTASAISLPYRPRALRARISRVAGAVLSIAGSIVVIGWLTDSQTLTRIAPDWATMKMNTAVGFVLLGIAYWLPGGARDSAFLRMIGRLCAGLATVIGMLTLAQYLDGIELQIDNLFFTHPVDGTPFPGRMSPGTAIAMTLIGLASLLVDWRTDAGNRPSLVLAVTVATMGLAASIGYLFDSRSLYSVPVFSTIALHTALLFIVASIGILGVHPDRGPFGVLASDGRGSRLARTLLPIGIALPALIGWLRLQGERAGYYDLEFGLALFATASILVFVTLIWVTANSLNREEVLSRRADEAREHEAIRRRILFEQASDGIFVLGPDQTVVEANQSLANMIGYTLGNIARMHPWDWIKDEAIRERMAGDWSALAAGRATFETQLQKADGSIMEADVSCSLAEFDNQRFLFFVCRDITERRQAESAIRANEAKHRNLIEQAADGIFISDPDGNFELVNSRCCELLGYQENELLGLNGRVTFLNEETSVDTSRLRVLKAGGDVRYERMLRRKDGSVFPAEVSVKLLESGSTQVIFHDITERHEQKQKIERLHRIQAMLSGINSAIVRIRNRSELLQETSRIAVDDGKFCIGWVGVIDHNDGRLQMVAQSGFLGDDREVVLNKTVQLVPEGPAEFAIFQQRPVFDNDIGRAAGASDIRRRAIRLGAQSVIALPLVVEGETFGVVVLYAQDKSYFDDEEIRLLRELADDVSFGLEFIAKEERVDYLSYYDATTGLPNRSQFFYRLSRQLQEAANGAFSTTLSLVDVDRFRMINDTYGRHEGDALIAAIARRLSDSVEDTDTVARIGSNTFAVAVTEKGDAAEIAHQLEERNQSVFREPFRVGREDLRISATTGVAVFPNDASSPEVLLANAEAALRSAKSGNHRYLLYSPDMNARVAESMRLENKLRLALENDELSLWYQPKVCAQSGKLKGLEALMRWQDQETGEMVPPDKFIPVMEHTGMILEAGNWAMWQVARDCAAWKAAGATVPHVAVNVSPIQLEQKDFVDSVVKAHEAVLKTGAELDLEITESVVMEQVDRIIPKLQTLHELGTRVSIDDFGTGYSSLRYIARLPIDALKIDRSFVFGLGESAESLAIVKSVISIAKALQLIVVAEGVETEEQVTLLRALECDELQGYYLGRPLPPDETLGVIRNLG